MNVANQPTQYRDFKPTITTAMVLISGNPSSSQPVCCYCSHLHKSINCESVVQTSARKQILKKSGRCFICLKRGTLAESVDQMEDVDRVKAVTTQAFVTIPRQAVLTLSKTVLADVFLLANLLIQVQYLQL